MKKIAWILAALAIVWFLFFRRGEVTHGPGVIAPEKPVQVRIQNPEPFRHKSYTITPLAEFDITARVLSRKNYRWDKDADLAPMDLALGWGRMSDESVLQSLTITQQFRWYRWSTKKFVIPKEEIEQHSANMHLVPADRSVRKEMKRTRTGDLVQFSGYLIGAKNGNGRTWTSSLTRTDTGNHACELVWVEEFEILTGR
jgi:hypothetical protein